MYAVSRRYRFDPAHAEQINREDKEFFAPMIEKAPGFIAYYWFDNGAGIGESLSVFATKEAAEGSVRMSATWVKMHQLYELLGAPEVLQGEIKAFAVAPGGPR